MRDLDLPMLIALFVIVLAAIVVIVDLVVEEPER